MFLCFFFLYVGDLIPLLFWTAESWLCLNRPILLATRGVPVGVLPFPWCSWTPSELLPWVLAVSASRRGLRWPERRPRRCRVPAAAEGELCQPRRKVEVASKTSILATCRPQFDDDY